VSTCNSLILLKSLSFLVTSGVFVNKAVAAIAASGNFIFESLRSFAAMRAIFLSYGMLMKFSSRNFFTSVSSFVVQPENDNSSVSTIVDIYKTPPFSIHSFSGSTIPLSPARYAISIFVSRFIYPILYELSLRGFGVPFSYF
jgi:hypothetical protein